MSQEKLRGTYSNFQQLGLLIFSKGKFRYQFLTRRMQELWLAFEGEGCLDFRDALYLQVARDEQDLALSNMHASSKQLFDDSKSQQPVVANLLASLHPEVIKALLRNDIIWRYKTNQEGLRDLLPNREKSPGIYINGFVVENKARQFLSPMEIVNVVAMLDEYLESPYSDNCREIDDALLGENGKTQPNRWLYDSIGKFRDTLIKRCGPNLDDKVDDHINQRQGPVHVGYAADVDKRLTEYMTDPSILNNKTAKAYALFLSICRVLEIKLTPVGFPVLALLNDEHRKLGEIVVCRLAGSMQEFGGFDVGQPWVKQSPLGAEQFTQNNLFALATGSSVMVGLRALNNSICARREVVESGKRAANLHKFDETAEVDLNQPDWILTPNMVFKLGQVMPLVEQRLKANQEEIDERNKKLDLEIQFLEKAVAWLGTNKGGVEGEKGVDREERERDDGEGRKRKKKPKRKKPYLGDVVEG